MSHSITCLNCDEPVSKKFCPNCGQKTDTHRITFKHFITHDVLHGVWHIERGILFTLKETFTRPGQAAIDYIKGKRIKYYNVFYLILLFIGLGIFIEHLYNNAILKYVSYIPREPQPISESVILEFIGKYIKFFITLAIPIYSFISYILFNKKKLNYSEHLIIFGMIYLGIIIITIVGNIMYFAEFIKPIAFLSEFSDYFVPITVLLYVIHGFYGAFGKDYKLLNFSLRLLLFIILVLISLKALGKIVKFFLIN
ncbi:DUF3667 domain-containing protein [Flavobacterium sp.]|uniref:DUF3667 domain-containing protein n=1 Tax=Flavobacterium sp. TaxID=239 RepID=UPI0026077964|nr:DUF3667 domain-containing protein [Flavobacterium sp.]